MGTKEKPQTPSENFKKIYMILYVIFLLAGVFFASIFTSIFATAINGTQEILPIIIVALLFCLMFSINYRTLKNIAKKEGMKYVLLWMFIVIIAFAVSAYFMYKAMPSENSLLKTAFFSMYLGTSFGVAISEIIFLWKGWNHAEV